jgi:hypothetical protein
VQKDAQVSQVQTDFGALRTKRLFVDRQRATNVRFRRGVLAEHAVRVSERPTHGRLDLGLALQAIRLYRDGLMLR